MPEHQQTQQSKNPEFSPQRRIIPTGQNYVSHPASIIQRARINPKSLTPTDILQLQSTIGNRAVGKLLSEIKNPPKVQQVPIQRQKLEEEEICPSCVQRQEIPEEEEPLQGVFENKPEQAACPSCIQRKELEEEEPLQTKRENNTGMPGNLKAGVENLSGIDMSDVRVYYNSSKPAEVGALAYTQGTNIHIAPGQEKHLPHEAWHVVQQVQGRVQPSVQVKGVSINDDVALEREADVVGAKALQMTRSDQVATNSKSGTPKSLQRRKRAASPFPVLQQTGGNSGTAAAVTKAPINRVVREVIQRDVGFEFETQQMWTKKTNLGAALPAAGFVNRDEGNAAFYDLHSTRVDKGAALLNKADVEVQADDSNFGGDSDLEVVTTHFPLNPVGRGRLDQAMTDVDTLIADYTHLEGAAGGFVPAAALNGHAGFNNGMNDGMFLGNWATAKTAGQVTLGTRLENIGDIVKDLHGDLHESPVDKNARDPGRLHMRRPNIANPNEPRATHPGEESSTLISGYELAKTTLNNYQRVHPTVPVDPKLEGLLTIIFTYCESMQYKTSFLKNHTPLMAKTDLATIFTTLPLNVRTYYSKKRWRKSNLERLISLAPGYEAKMGRPLFYGVTDLVENNRRLGKKQWYHSLTLRSWLEGIILGTDKLTNANFPRKPASQQVEGYGALGVQMDTHIGTGDTLPIFELRSANRLITYNEAHQWALDFFDYVQSLNDNPVGGYARILRRF